MLAFFLSEDPQGIASGIRSTKMSIKTGWA
jgi:hypothetical protein